MKTLAFIALVIFPALLPFSVCNAQSNSELKAQANARYEKADKEMNAAYKQLMSILSKEGKAHLKVSQRAWNMFRDAQAAFDSHHLAGGTAQGLERTGSLHLLTQARTKRLLANYKRFKEIYE